MDGIDFSRLAVVGEKDLNRISNFSFVFKRREIFPPGVSTFQGGAHLGGMVCIKFSFFLVLRGGLSNFQVYPGGFNFCRGRGGFYKFSHFFREGCGADFQLAYLYFPRDGGFFLLLVFSCLCGGGFIIVNVIDSIHSIDSSGYYRR